MNEHRKQFVSFSFYKVAPEWRRLPAAEKAEHRREFSEVARRWDDHVCTLSYSLVGLRGDCDFLLWRIAYSLEELQEMSSMFLRTPLGGYLAKPYSFLAMTRRSAYRMGDRRGSEVRGVLTPGGSKYLFVFPITRTRNWYTLPFEERQRMINELTKLAAEFPQVHSNVLYSFGLDDQDFVMTIECDDASLLVDRMMRYREADSSNYLMRDTPMFTCVRGQLDEVLEKIG